MKTKHRFNVLVTIQTTRAIYSRVVNVGADDAAQACAVAQVIIDTFVSRGRSVLLNSVESSLMPVDGCSLEEAILWALTESEQT